MNTIFTGLFGSHLYHLDTEKSDKDYKSIYIPTLRDVVLGKAKKNITTSSGKSDEKNGVGDIDHETFALHEFVKLACQGQTVAIDMLHTSPDLLESDPMNKVWWYLMIHRKKFYSKNMNAFMGYVKKQASKYGIKGSKLANLEIILAMCTANCEDQELADSLIKVSDLKGVLPENEYSYWVEQKVSTGNKFDTRFDSFYVVNGSMMRDKIGLDEFRSRVLKQYQNYGARAIQAKENDGLDWKAISHALRAGYQLHDIFVKGDFNYPLDQTEFLLDVKLGKLDYVTEVAPELERLVDELDMLAKVADLPDEVNTDFWDDFVFNVYTTGEVE